MHEAGRSKYSLVAMAFHWVIAIAVIWNWRIAEAAEHAASREEASAIMVDHKALGITILALTLGRLAWRLMHQVPPLPQSIPGWERVAARTLHIIFYVLLVGLPLGGWLANSYFGNVIDWFGVFSIPALPVGENPDVGKAIFGLHKTGGTVMLYLIALHVLAAFWHSLPGKGGGIMRMLPFGRT